MERIAESESPERYKRRKEEGEGTVADRGRKLNNQTFPEGSRGLLWKPTPGRAMAMAVK